MTRTILLVTAVATLASPAVARAEVRYVRAGDNLQAALNAARPGDELRLAPEATFSGNFVLPVTTGSAMIVVRTDLPDEVLPGARQRVTPDTAARFAKIVSPNTAAALRTAAGAHHWRLAYLEFPSTREGYGDIIQLGDGSAAQNTLESVPYELVLDHLYIHGHPLYGQKRGIALNARTVTIRHCYISDIKAVGADTQAIGSWNGPGPYSIENNYLEASGEVVLFGGSDPAIPNLVPEDISVRFNHMTRPMSWREPIVPAPTDVTAVAAAGGSLPAGVYAFRVVARRSTGSGTTGTSTASAEVTAVASSGAIQVSWAPVADATEYAVYVRNPAGATQFWTTPSAEFLHNGSSAGRTGTPPSAGTEWQIKNIFELKNARRVQIESNVFDNNWKAAQPGYAILFTPRNQGGQCSWCVIEQVSFSHNVMRNVAGGFNITGYDSNGVTGQTNAILIQDNLITGVTTGLGGAGWPFLVGDAVRDLVIDHNTIDFDGTTLLYAYGGTKSAPRQMPGFRFTNNAARHGQYGINGADASTGTLTLQMYFPEPVVTGNWLSGGSSSRYPPGNRFEEPFDPQASSSLANTSAPGANISRLMSLADNVVRGVMTVAPQPPRGLRIIGSGK
jgi:hypothetical protein